MAEILVAASTEMAEAAVWYDARVAGLGERFLLEAEAAFARIDEKPLTGPPWKHRRLPEARSPSARRCKRLSTGTNGRTCGARHSLRGSQGKNAVIAAKASAYLAEHGRLTTSAVTVSEIVYGLRRVGREDRVALFEASLADADVLPFDDDAARLAGESTRI